MGRLKKVRMGKFLPSRKGVSYPFMTLVAAVTGVAVLMILLGIFRIVGENSAESAQNSRCKTSVAAYAHMQQSSTTWGGSEASESQIECPTEYITLGSERSPNQMRRDVADQMVDCWDNYGRGQLMLFSAQDQKFCVICSVIDFEDTSTHLDGLSSFMMTEQLPRIPGRERMSYSEFISGVQTDPDIVDSTRSGADLAYLDGSKRYAIMFTYYKQSYWSQVRRAIWGAGAGALAAVVVIGGTVLALTLAGATVGIGAPLSVLIVTGSIAAGAAIGAGSADENAEVYQDSAAWDANVIIAEYDSEMIASLGCEYLPVSQLDQRFAYT